MEVNMSPNLYAGADLIGSLDFYENIVENVLKVIGFGRKSSKPTDSDLAVNTEICAVKCQESCDANECQICVKCMTDENKEDFRKAYEELLNLGEFRRVVPPANVSFKKYFSFILSLICFSQKIIKKFTTEDWEKLTDQNIIHHFWFSEMCKKNRRFC